MSAGATVVWITGLPASGKTTLATRARLSLQSASHDCLLLDGDEVRQALCPVPGYSPQAREDFYTSLANLAALLAKQGLIVIVPATACLRQYRDYAKQKAPRFIEVYVDTPQELCSERDVKGLYARSQTGELRSLPGLGAPYECPDNPDIVARGGHDEVAVASLLSLLQ